MEINQSLFNSIFSRVYESVVQIVIAVLVLLLISIIWPEQLSTANWFFIVAFPFLISIAYTSLISLFEPRPHLQVVIRDEGFDFCKFGHKKTVLWTEFINYKITKFIPHQFVLHLNNKNNIRFSYYAFSKEQRKTLIAAFEDKIRQKESY